MKVLACGDIHTKTWVIDLVEAMLPDYDAVVFCGDYADNWGAHAQESLKTWQRLFDLSKKYPGKVYPVKGNHDYVYLERTPTSQSGFNPGTQILIDAPENKELKDWLISLPLVLELDGVTYSHAGIDERWGGDQSVNGMWQDLSPIWVRPDWARYKNIKMVMGHTPQKTCTEVEPDIWLIDTFSQYPDGRPIGDGSMLEVIDGGTFKKIKTNDHSNSSGFSGGLS